jgi:hypothetical protein
MPATEAVGRWAIEAWEMRQPRPWEMRQRQPSEGQPPESLARASRNMRPPVDRPVWVSSPTRSTIAAASSAPLGGCTEWPASIMSSASKPWRGTGGSVGVDTRCLGAAPALARGREAAGLAAVCRAAARRALGRWGRVLGRLDSTPGSSMVPSGEVSRLARRLVPGEVGWLARRPLPGEISWLARRLVPGKVSWLARRPVPGEASLPVRWRPPGRLSLLGELMSSAQSSRIPASGIRYGGAQALT